MPHQYIMILHNSITPRGEQHIDVILTSHVTYSTLDISDNGVREYILIPSLLVSHLWATSTNNEVLKLQ